MILDNALQLMTAYSPTAVATNWQNSLWYDLKQIEDWGPGSAIDLVIQIAASCTSGGAATVQFALQGDTNTNFSTNLQTISASQAYAYSTLTAGYQVPPVILGRVTTGYRYLRAVVIIGTAVLTGGTFNAWLVPRNVIQDNGGKYGQRNYNV